MPDDDDGVNAELRGCSIHPWLADRPRRVGEAAREAPGSSPLVGCRFSRVVVTVFVDDEFIGGNVPFEQMPDLVQQCEQHLVQPLASTGKRDDGLVRVVSVEERRPAEVAARELLDVDEANPRVGDEVREILEGLRRVQELWQA